MAHSRLAEKGAIEFAVAHEGAPGATLAFAGYVDKSCDIAGTLLAPPLSRLTAKGRILGQLWDYQQSQVIP